MTKPAIAWFRRNLRLTDNPSWLAACESGRPLIAVYVSDELDAGGASRWWLHGSLASLGESLQAHGVDLVIREGNPVTILSDIVADTGATALYCSRRFEPEARRQEKRLRDTLGDDVERFVYDDYLLRHPKIIKTGSGSAYRVFTPFYRASSAAGEPGLPLPAPDAVQAFSGDVDGLALDDLKLLPTKPDWAGGLRSNWEPGEAGALRQLDEFEGRVAAYADNRDLPAVDGTSRLSPHLHYGEISPRQTWHAIRQSGGNDLSGDRAEPFLRQLYWR
ncbi:MAG: deoxyribodipyrimidine photo-lyase, partial [Pseudomonadota bacterium]